ncbi:MAG TPA: hypothetical protein VIP48_18915 [Streptosporangiaceae bacterium]
MSCTVNAALAWRPVRLPTAVTWYRPGATEPTLTCAPEKLPRRLQCATV